MDESPGGAASDPSSTGCESGPSPVGSAADVPPPIPAPPIPAPPIPGPTFAQRSLPPSTLPVPPPVAWTPTAPPPPVTWTPTPPVPTTAIARLAPIAHRRSGTVLLGAGILFVAGALAAAASGLRDLLEADPAVRHLTAVDRALSAAAGYLVVATILIAAGTLVEWRWLRRLRRLRPPRIAAERRPDRSSSDGRHRARRLRVPTPWGTLVAERTAWAGSPDGSFDRLAWLWALLIAETALLGGAAIAVIGSADPAYTRTAVTLAMVATGTLAITVLVAMLLLRRLAGVVDRRAALVISGLHSQPIEPDRGSGRWGPFVVAGLGAFVLLLIGGATVSSRTVVSCDASADGCRVVTVPFDRSHPDDPRTMSIEYAVAPATDRRQGVLIVAVGGPGDSGLDEMPGRLEDIDPRVRAAYDIVFFDQRGTGASGGLSCPHAAQRMYYGTDVDAAQGFATDCIGEIGVASPDLHVYGTLQAAEDVDAIRDQLGADRTVLYGESYGTRLAQVYASRHPDRLSALVLDGVVDMQSSGVDFWSESARGFDATFQATEAACLADPHCSADLDGHSGAALLRDFLVRAANGGQVMLPDPGGPSFEAVDPSEIEHAIATSLYTEAGRATVQRAIAELARGDSTVLGHLVEIDREIGPQGLSLHVGGSSRARGAADSAGGIAAYYAIECADYDYPSGSTGDLAFEVAQRRADNEGVVLDAVVSQDMPCDYWPAHGSAVGKLTAPSIPTLVLAATTDPVTPPANADRTAARLPDGSLVTSQGGPHVTWRIANACVDDAVDGLLLQGTLPPTGSTCPDRVADPYTPLPPTGQAGLPALDAMDAIRTETFALPELQYWDGIDRIEVPCSFGGMVDITTDATAPIRSMNGPSPAGVPVDYHYTGCDVSGSLAFDGDATYDPASGVYRLTARIGNDSLLLTVDKNGHRVVQGTWHGEPVNDHD